jgi:hypothetical protein
VSSFSVRVVGGWAWGAGTRVRTADPVLQVACCARVRVRAPCIVHGCIRVSSPPREPPSLPRGLASSPCDVASGWRASGTISSFLRTPQPRHCPPAPRSPQQTCPPHWPLAGVARGTTDASWPRWLVRFAGRDGAPPATPPGAQAPQGTLLANSPCTTAIMHPTRPTLPSGAGPAHVALARAAPRARGERASERWRGRRWLFGGRGRVTQVTDCAASIGTR